MPDGVRVAIRLTPRAKADRVVAVAAAAGGGRVVKASVTAPAEDGRANEALLQLLARAWRLPRRDLAIVAGAVLDQSHDPRRRRLGREPHRQADAVRGRGEGQRRHRAAT